MRAIMIVFVVLASVVSIASAAGHSGHRILFTRHDGVVIRQAPARNAHPITTVPAETQLELLGRWSAWSHVRVWSTTSGWTQSRDLVHGPAWHSTSHYLPPSLSPSSLHASGVRKISVRATADSPLTLMSGPNGPVIGSLPARSRFTVDSWQEDGSGLVWYHARQGWTQAGTIRFTSTRALGNAHAVAGKGMWLTEGTVADSDPAALAAAACKLGLTHVYVEFADSPLGLYGTKGINGLLAAAHHEHISVIAWVYPYLRDVASDVALTRKVAAYRSESGLRFDGIAVDLEDNIHAWNVRAYSQLVRLYLGPHALIVGVVWNPQAFPHYPFRAVAESDDALTPMDYWHDRKGTTGWAYPSLPYGFAYAEKFAQESIAGIRAASGDQRIPIAPIGQMFDNFGRDELGPDAPTPAEISGFLRGCAGAWGVSFFQWMTATPPEWSVFKGWRIR